MTDIEERAKKWTDEYLSDQEFPEGYEDLAQALIAAYLAGAGQVAVGYSVVFSYRGQR